MKCTMCNKRDTLTLADGSSLQTCMHCYRVLLALEYNYQRKDIAKLEEYLGCSMPEFAEVVVDLIMRTVKPPPVRPTNN